MTQFRINLLGCVSVSYEDSKLLELTGAAARLFVYLSLHPGKAISREEIAAAFWPDEETDATLGRLRQTLHSLRSSLNDHSIDPQQIISATRSNLSLISGVAALDASKFEFIVVRALQSQITDDRLIALKEAESLYRGPLAPDIDGEWIEPHRLHLSNLHRRAMLELARCLAEKGDFELALSTVRRQLAENPHSEDSISLLMQILAAAGQPGEVPHAYKDFKRILKREIGSDPSHELDSLAKSLANPVSNVQLVKLDPVNPSPSDSDFVSKDGPLSRRTKRHGVIRWLFVAVIPVVISGIWIIYSRSTRQGQAAGAFDAAKLLWHRELPMDRGYLSSEPIDISVGPDNIVHVSGFRKNSTTDVDTFHTGFDLKGKSLYEGRIDYYNGPGNDLDRAVTACWVGPNCFLIAGESDNGHGNNHTRLSGLDIAICNYADNGNRSILRWNSPRDGEDRPIKVKGSFVCGRTWMSGNDDSDARYAWVVMDTANGDKLRWTRTLFDRNVVDATPTDMVVSGGSPIVAGYVIRNAPSGMETACMVVCLDPKTGTVKWSREVCVVPGRRTRGWHIATTLEGVVVCGESTNLKGSANGSGSDIFVARLNPEGTVKWAHSWNGTSNRNDQAEALATTNDGVIYVAGITETDGVTKAIVLVAFAADGSKLWDKQYAGFTRGENSPKAISLNHATGCIYVAGSSTTAFPNGFGFDQWDAVLLKYDANGKLVWKDLYDAQKQQDWACAISVAPNGQVLVAGQSIHDGFPRTVVRCYAP